VTGRFSPASLPRRQRPLFTAADRLVSAGSCFAANMIPWLEAAGLDYLRCEPVPAAFRDLPEAMNYGTYSAAYGNIYTARQLCQLLDRALGLFTPREDRWHEAGRVIDPFRPGLRYPAGHDAEFDALTRQHLAAVRQAFSSATAVVFTLGLTEAWLSAADGAVFPACPGTLAGSHDPQRHRFKNFSVSETCADLLGFHDRLRAINPGARLVLTLSPVPLQATATGLHVVEASILSKSVLRAAIAEAQRQRAGIDYFPAYEIITGPQAPDAFFDADRRSVSRAGVAAVMGALLAHCQAPQAAAALTALEDWRQGGAAPSAVQASPPAGALPGTDGPDGPDPHCEEAMVASIALAQRFR